MAQLKGEIEQEKQDKKDKRAKEREAAWRVIRENEAEKLNR